MTRIHGVFALVLTALLLAAAAPAPAHFGMIIPSDQMVMQGDDREIDLHLLFWHPFEGLGMDLVKPEAFVVEVNGEKQDLLSSLTEKTIDGKTTWTADYPIKRPGLYVFHLTPQPYWEPAEDCFIVHLPKVYVSAFGDEEGWDQPLGLKTEIVPLSKPYGLYAGNVFQGRVLFNGRPVPHAEVEVEYYNQNGDLTAPSDLMITQTIKADQNGVFTYAAPKAGWWGFAALNTAEEKKEHDGQPKDVELGAVIWVKFHDMK